MCASLPSVTCIWILISWTKPLRLFWLGYPLVLFIPLPWDTLVIFTLREFTLVSGPDPRQCVRPDKLALFGAWQMFRDWSCVRRLRLILLNWTPWGDVKLTGLSMGNPGQDTNWEMHCSLLQQHIIFPLRRNHWDSASEMLVCEAHHNHLKNLCAGGCCFLYFHG